MRRGTMLKNVGSYININVNKLTDLAINNTIAYNICEALSNYKCNRQITTVDRICFMLKRNGVSMDRKYIIETLKSLSSTGCGKYIKGSKGHKSRFEWFLGARETARLILANRSRKVRIPKIQNISTAG